MYTNIVNIPDSILFLTSCRLSIREFIMSNRNLDLGDRREAADYIMNEASDYQVMSIVVNDEYIEEKYDSIAELELFDDFKAMVVENIDQFSGIMESQDLKSILYEIGPVSQEGISTAGPILNYLFESGVIYEKNKLSDTAKAAGKAARGAANALKSGYSGERGGVNLRTGEAGFQAKGKGQKVGQAAGKVIGALKSGKSKAADAGSKVKSAPGKVAGAVSRSLSSVKSGYSGERGGVNLRTGEAGFQAKGKGQKVGQAAGKVVGGVTSAGRKVADNKGTIGKVAGVIALVAAATYAGFKVYQRFMSQAAKACSGQGGAEKTACMNKYKANALKAQISTIQKGAASCAKSKNPEKCKQAINNKIEKLKGKLGSIAA